jgi:hypothetical protein
MAGVAQAVGEVWNTTLNTAAHVAAEVADAIANAEVEQVTYAAAAQAGNMPSVGGVPLILSDTVDSSSSSDGSSSSSSSSAKEVLRAGATAALDTLSHAYRDKGQPILQPIFQGLANIVNNATYGLLNKTGEGIVELGESAKLAVEKRFQPTFDLGKPPVKDAAGDVQAPRLMLLVVSVWIAGAWEGGGSRWPARGRGGIRVSGGAYQSVGPTLTFEGLDGSVLTASGCQSAQLSQEKVPTLNFKMHSSLLWRWLSCRPT